MYLSSSSIISTCLKILEMKACSLDVPTPLYGRQVIACIISGLKEQRAASHISSDTPRNRVEKSLVMSCTVMLQPVGQTAMQPDVKRNR